VQISKWPVLVTHINGVSGKAILEAIIDGNESPKAMATLAKGRLRTKREALEQALVGRVQAHHRFILQELLCLIEHLDESIQHFDMEIEACCRPFEEAIDRLDTIPGVARETAEVIGSEIGWDCQEVN
jgi:transposase